MRPENRIAAIAQRQCGIVTRKQLLHAGLDSAAIMRKLRAGWLHPVHRGVYLVGHPVPPAGAREMAAALACGPQAFVSHRDAAVLHKLLPHPAQPCPVHVTVVDRHNGNRPGICVHRINRSPLGDFGTLGGIPVTSPTRTLIDLAGAGAEELERALAEAQVRDLVTAGELRGRVAGRRGAKLVHTLLDVGPSLTRSEAERRLLRLIRTASLPSPRTNAPVNGHEVDFLWPDQRLVVEVDGFAFHRSRPAFERDRERDAALTAAGYAVVRITWRQLEQRPEAVVARLAGALASR